MPGEGQLPWWAVWSHAVVRPRQRMEQHSPGLQRLPFSRLPLPPLPGLYNYFYLLRDSRKRCQPFSQLNPALDSGGRGEGELLGQPDTSDWPWSTG